MSDKDKIFVGTVTQSPAAHRCLTRMPGQSDTYGPWRLTKAQAMADVEDVRKRLSEKLKEMGIEFSVHYSQEDLPQA